MASSLSPADEPAVSLDDDQNILRCLMCHTSVTLSLSALEAGGDWKCVRCGQHWDARRLATVAAYTAWTVGPDRTDRLATDDSPGPERIGSLRTERSGGRP
jgi:hypothetical protein